MVVRLSTKKKQSRWRQHGGDLNIYDELAVAPTPEPEANKKKKQKETETVFTPELEKNSDDRSISGYQ